MTEPPKKRIITGLDIADLGKIRPTRIPSAGSVRKIRKHKIRWRRLGIDAGILALIIVAAYGLSFLGGFVFNDHYIDKFITIRVGDENFWSNLVIKGISRPLSQPWITAGFAFDVQNFGLETVWYHVINLILHFLSCVYFYIFAYRLARHFWSSPVDNEPIHAVPLLASALFACHPLACESVAHISGRPATITACNIFLALNFFLSGFLAVKVETSVRDYFLTFIFFLLAIFSDLQSLALPAVMILMAFLLKGTNIDYKNWLKKRWSDFIFIGFLSAMVPIIAIRGFSADFSNGFATPAPGNLVYIVSQFRSLITYYLRCLLVPLGLSIYPPFAAADHVVDLLAIGGVIVLASAFYFTYRLRKEPLAALGLGMAAIFFVPPIFCIQNEIASDRRFYLCLAGLSLFLAAKLKNWLAGDQKDGRVRTFACLLILMFSTISAARTCDFRSDFNLLQSALNVNKTDSTAKGLLALVLVKENKVNLGIETAQQAIKLNRFCQPAYLALGKAHLPQHSEDIRAEALYRQAKGDLEQAVSLAKSQHLGQELLFESELSLATALVELHEYQRAKDLSAEALEVNPSSIILNLVMGKSLNGLGRYMEAFRYLDKGFSRDNTNPDYVEPLTEAGLGVGTASTISTAYNTAKLGLRIKPTPQLHLLLARAAFAMVQFQESMQWTDIVLKEAPNNAQALYLRSYQLQIIGQNEQAQKMRARALLLEPDLKTKMPIVFVNKQNNSVVDLVKLIEARSKLKSKK